MSLRRFAIVVTLSLALLPVPPTAAADRGGRGGERSTPMRTSVHHEEAERHAGDRIRFTPGGRVTILFRPRPGDDWTVDGEAPKALPAGELSGRQIAAEADPPATPQTSPTDDDVESETLPTRPALEPPPSEPDPAAPIRSAIPGRMAAASEPAIVAAPGAERWATERLLSAPVGDGGLRREVFGFLPYWELTDASTRLDYSLLSTIAYFGVGADRDGHLIRQRANGSRDVGWAGWTSSALTAVINAAHAKRTRVVLTVQRFGWTTRQLADTKALLGSEAARRTLAAEVARAVSDRGADGVNLDFEPIPSGYGDEYVAFVRQVRRALDARSEGYQLTLDTTGSIGAYDIAALTGNDAADAVFIMGYDYRTSGAGTAGSIAPLTGPRYDLTDTVDAYLARIPASRIILGVPYYGRAWSTTSDALHARTRPGSSTYGYSTSVIYGTAVEQAAEHGRRWDGTEQAAWTAYRWKACDDCPATWRQLYYDDVQSLGRKYDLINARGLRGAGIWALGYDGTRPELYALLKAKFREDSSPPTAGLLALPATTRDASLRVRWTARDDTAVDRYDVHVSVDGGAWSSWLDDTTRTSASYPARDGHGYAFRVRARDPKGHWSEWDIADTWRSSVGDLRTGGFGQAVGGSLTMRATPDTSARKVGRLPSGARVKLVGGPRRRDGLTWYQVIGPLRSWAAVNATHRGWVGTSGSGGRLRPTRAPNTTTMDVLIDDLRIGAIDRVRATRASSTGDASKVAPLFSPGSDGVRDGLRLSYRLDDGLESLSLIVVRASDGRRLGSRALPGRTRGGHVYDWDGAIAGRRVPDGSYRLQLVGRRGTLTAAAPTSELQDPTFDARPWTATVDTSGPTVSDLAARPGAISPDGDGRQERMSLRATAGPGTTSWSVRVLDARDRVVRTFDGRSRDVAATWDGRDARGDRLPDGTYRLELRASDALGNDGLASRTVSIDTRDPSHVLQPIVSGLLPAATAGTFSPDGDGWQDAVDFRVVGAEPVAVTLVVRDGAGRRQWSGAAQLTTQPSVRWNGRGRDRRPLRDGVYRVVATLTDAAGNRATTTTRVRIDRTAGHLRPSPALFHAQDGDRLARATNAGFRLRDRASTTLRVLDAAGRVVRAAWTSRVRPPGQTTWRWDGRDARGRLVAPGAYQLELVASADGVRQVIRRAVRVDAFSIEPVTLTPAAGTRLAVIIRAAERLRAAPRITLDQVGAPDRTVTARRLADGRYRAVVTFVAGSRGRARLIVRGVDVLGGVESSTLALTVR